MISKLIPILLIFTLVLAASSCGVAIKEKKGIENIDKVSSFEIESDSIIVEEEAKIFEIDSSKIAFGFDFPVGKPDSKGYYNYQGFTKNNHLGEDWNGIGGGNTDLGDTIYAIANGHINYAEDFGGRWGNTIRITHELPNGKLYESVYTHCDTILAKKTSWALKGEPIGTIGTGHGLYLAHLHLEIREEIGLPIGDGYSTDTTGYVNPTTFIKAHRKVEIVVDTISTRSK